MLQGLAPSKLAPTSPIIGRPLERKGRHMVGIDSLLHELVSVLDEATGAIIVAGDGEAVLWGTSEQTVRLRLRGAYVAVVMKTFRAASARIGLGGLRHLVVEYDGATVIVHEIDDDCSVVLELKPNATVGRALYRLQTIAARLRDEIAL